MSRAEVMERAKQLFLRYAGNRFYMDLDGRGGEYEIFRVSKETEDLWAEELVRGLRSSKKRGREALGEYSAAAQLSRRLGSAEDRRNCLFHPLRAPELDDVTRLFMLSDSFRMAERAAAEGSLSGEEAEAYLAELDAFSALVIARAENGSLSSSEDYVMREFSDPEYVSRYLTELRVKWTRLL
jgi:hypothetical protein